jgi:hypothetical protein
MVHGVADHVHQGISDLLDDRAVDFRVFAAGVKVDLLLAVAGEVAHQALHFLERRFDRNQANRHRIVLQFLGDAAKLRDVARQVGIFVAHQPGRLCDLALHDHQLAHHIHHRVQFIGIDADRTGRPRALEFTGGSGFLVRGLLGRLGGGGAFKRDNIGRHVSRRGRHGGRSGRNRQRHDHGFDHGSSHGRRRGRKFGDRLRLFRLRIDRKKFDGPDQVIDRHDGAGQLAMLERQRDLAHHHLNRVAALQHGGDNGRIEPEFAIARQIEQGLDLVREGVHRRQVEKTGDALDRMERTEDLIQRVAVFRLSIEDEQRRLDVSQVIEGLGVEFQEEFPIFVEVEVHDLVETRPFGGRFGRIRTRSVCRNGDRGHDCRLAGEHHRGSGLGGRQSAGQPLHETLESRQGAVAERLGRVQQDIQQTANACDFLLQDRVTRGRLDQLTEQAVRGDQTIVTTNLGENRFSRQTVECVFNGRERGRGNRHDRRMGGQWFPRTSTRLAVGLRLSVNSL